MDYVELTIEFSEVNPWRDIMISILSEKGADGFIETKTALKGYMPKSEYKEVLKEEVEKIKGVASVEIKLIKDQNWNAKWEENFEPVLVGSKLAIRAPFHEKTFNTELTITIQPQMSFGTGHHETTWMMANRLFDLDLMDKEMLDMGTGTGILAILAEKRGAKSVFAPDIDKWSYRNALENSDLNDCERLQIEMGNADSLSGKSFDIIVANINKNVLIEQFSVYSKCINPSGKLLISGFFETDQHDIKKAAEQHGFIFEDIYTKAEWAMMEFCS
jgi:ribosomal protein L11 methyltransferase